MAANFDPGDVVRLATVWKYAGAGDIVNVQHVRLGTNVGGTDTAVINDLNIYVRAQYATIINAIPTIVTHDRIEVKNVTTGAILTAIGPDANLDGAAAGQALSPDTTALIVFRTLVSRVIGRVYLPPFHEGAQNAGVIDPTVIPGMANFGAYTLTEQNLVNGTDVQYVVLRGSGANLVPSGYRVITSTRKQARRQAGRGS